MNHTMDTPKRKSTGLESSVSNKKARRQEEDDEVDQRAHQFNEPIDYVINLLPPGVLPQNDPIRDGHVSLFLQLVNDDPHVVQAGIDQLHDKVHNSDYIPLAKDSVRILKAQNRNCANYHLHMYQVALEGGKLVDRVGAQVDALDKIKKADPVKDGAGQLQVEQVGFLLKDRHVNFIHSALFSVRTALGFNSVSDIAAVSSVVVLVEFLQKALARGFLKNQFFQQQMTLLRERRIIDNNTSSTRIYVDESYNRESFNAYLSLILAVDGWDEIPEIREGRVFQLARGNESPWRWPRATDVAPPAAPSPARATTSTSQDVPMESTPLAAAVTHSGHPFSPYSGPPATASGPPQQASSIVFSVGRKPAKTASKKLRETVIKASHGSAGASLPLSPAPSAPNFCASAPSPAGSSNAWSGPPSAGNNGR